jgi:quaternary ammonium compound-resistance protein SugE
MAAWLCLLAAGALEIGWAAALKASDGLSRPLPAVLGLAGAALSLFLLSAALRSLPVSMAYAVWVGIGTAGVAAYGVLALGEPLGMAKAGFLAMIGIGVAGLAASAG